MKLFLILAACFLAVSAYEPINLFNSAAEPRIITGLEASNTDFPHQVALQVTSQYNDEYEKCGGALLAESIVLTAAHCFDAYGKQGFAYFGSNRYMNGTKIPFNRVIVHEKYENTPFKIINDVALVKLDSPVKIDGVKIKTIKLNPNELQDNIPVTVSGFGYISDFNDTEKLHYVALTTISNKNCNDLYGSWVIDKHVCAKGATLEATCHGDSGGALLINWPENPTHVGIVSFGPESCEDGSPVVFSRTADYIDWIIENSKLL